jgi:hypothetical protein
MSVQHYGREDFERYDSKPWKVGDELRFLCPECGDSKPRDNQHRSLRLRLVGDKRGLYLCGRCELKGKIKDEWVERPKLSRRARAVAAISQTRLAARPQPQAEPPHSQKLERLAVRMEAYRRAFWKSPGAAYLEGRGIPAEVAELAGVGYAERWEHWEEKGGAWELLGADRRVVFPVLDRDGRLVAISGRAVDAEFCRAKFISQGPKSHGLFWTPGALSSRVVAVTEAAIDALALWLCGVPAIAGIGTTFPEWMPRAFAFKHVLLATDEDEPDEKGRRAGQEAAASLVAPLQTFGAKICRLSAGVWNDWGSALEALGAERMRSGLVGFAEDSDDLARACHADDLAARGEMESARFVAGLVEDAHMRESLKASMVSGLSLWRRAFNHPQLGAALDKLARLGVEVYAVEQAGETAA